VLKSSIYSQAFTYSSNPATFRSGNTRSGISSSTVRQDNISLHAMQVKVDHEISRDAESIIDDPEMGKPRKNDLLNRGL
jgi:hypothetical protein